MGRPKKNIRPKPIALIVPNFKVALDWVFRNHDNVQEYANHQNRIVADGVEYVIVTHLKQLEGLEIKSYKVPVQLHHIPDLDLITALAKTRVR